MEPLLCAKNYTQALMTESCTEGMVSTHREFTTLDGHQTANNLILCDKCCNWEIHTAFGSKEDYLPILPGWVEKRIKKRMLIS